MNWIVSGAALFVAAALIGLVQMWFSVFDGAIFLKIELTLLVLLVVEATLWFIVRELRDYRRQTDSSALDRED